MKAPQTEKNPFRRIAERERERICEETLDDGEEGGGEEEDRRDRWRREYRGIGFGTKSAGR